MAYYEEISYKSYTNGSSTETISIDLVNSFSDGDNFWIIGSLNDMSTGSLEVIVPDICEAFIWDGQSHSFSYTSTRGTTCTLTINTDSIVVHTGVQTGYDLTIFKRKLTTLPSGFNNFTSGDYYYIISNLQDKTLSVKVIDTTKASYTNIPSTIVYNAVTYTTKYMSRCFSGCTNLITSPDIPTTVTNLSYCFYGCSSLTTAPTIHGGVTDLSYCFRECTSLVNAPTISYGVISLYSSFQGCTNLVNVPQLPKSITSLTYCFYGCSSLVTAPSLPDNVSYIDSCFLNCTSLTTAPKIPRSVTNMYACFKGCSALTGNIYVLNTPTSYNNIFTDTSQTIRLITLEDGESRTTWKTIANSYSNVSVPATEGITNDYEYQFSLISSLNLEYLFAIDKTKSYYNAIPSTITLDGISYTITSLSNRFYNCTNLIESPVIPNNIINLSGTFHNCYSLMQAPDIPSSVTNITRCFKNCNNLSGNIKVENSNITDSTDCFIGTTNQIKICVDSSAVKSAWQPIANEYDNVSIFLESFINGDYIYSIINYSNYVRAKVVDTTKTTFEDIPSTVLEDGKLYKVVSLGEASLGQESGCFYGCSSLMSVPNIPNTIKSMDYCFSGQLLIDDYATIDIPDSVISMQYCFEDAQIPYIPTFPKNLISLKGCFKNTSVTGSVVVDSTNAIPDSVIDMTECFKGTNITECYIPVNVKYLDNCFDTCYSLTDIFVAALPKSAYGIFEFTQEVISIRTSTDTGNRAFWKNIANDYSNITILDGNVLSDKGDYLFTLQVSSETTAECYTYAIGKTKYEDIPGTILVDNVSYTMTSINACFANDTSIVTAQIIPETVNNVYLTFKGCPNLEGNIIVYNEPTSYNKVFEGTIKDIYIYAKNKENSVWKTIANQYSNVHFVESNDTINIDYNTNTIDFGDKTSNNSSSVNFNYDTELRTEFYIYNNELYDLLVDMGWLYVEQLV